MTLSRRSVRATLRSLACVGSPAAPGGDYVGDGDRVLFVGNSHTYVNDVPGLRGAAPIAVGSIARGATRRSTTSSRRRRARPWDAARG